MRDRICSRHRYSGFTLVELLVVIGIIAVLVGIILPALTKAQSAAKRAQCLSNQRQLAQAMNLYMYENKGRFPFNFNGMNASLAWYVWYKEAEAYPFTDQGWFGLGMLFRKGYFKDPKAFYCPEMREVRFTYPDGWIGWGGAGGHDRKSIGYLYRLFHQNIPPYVTQQEVDKISLLRMGKFRGRIAISADIFYYWPHSGNPYGVNVAFPDGHAEWVNMTKYDFEVSQRVNNMPSGSYDKYVYFFWRAIETEDYKDFSKMVDAQDWAGLRAKYPPLF